jgi:hypothetical protein
MDINRKFDCILKQSRASLLSSEPSRNSLRTEQPVLQQAELELITKFPPSILFCFHSRLYFEPCLKCRRSRREGRDNLARFQQQVTDFT